MPDAYALSELNSVVPGIIYGTAWKKDRTAELVGQALEAGFRGFDTACQPKHYNEKGVGLGLQSIAELGLQRQDLFIQTKYTPLSSQDPQQLPYNKNVPVAEQVRQSFEVSQNNLQTDYVDALLLHSPLETHEETMQAWEALESIHQAGGARYLGITNCYSLDVLKQLDASASIKPMIVQNRFYKDTQYEVNTRQWCEQKGITFESFWSLTANAHILGSETMKTLAAEYGKTPAQVFFRFLNQSAIVPLSGTTSMQHMQEDLDIFEFSLPSEALYRISLLLTA